MDKHKLRRGVGRAAAVGAAALSATLIVGAGVASASPPSDPAGGSNPVPPHFYNGNVEGIRDSGSDTTFFMMQKIGDLYTGAGLYGCSLDTGTGQALYNTADNPTATTLTTALSSGVATTTLAVNPTGFTIPSGTTLVIGSQTATTSGATNGTATTININSFTPSANYAIGTAVGAPYSTTSTQSFYCQNGANVDTTDVTDNWDRTEVTQGVDNVGSGAGQNQLCNAASTPLAVDFSRSSKPAGSACSTMVQTGYAKDGVPVIDYPINPSTYGTSTFYSSINGGVVGPVNRGWLPGDPTSGTVSGTRLSDIDNNDNGATSSNATSTAYRIWCSTATSGQSTQIKDWGQLTNLGGTAGGLEVPGVVLNGNQATVPVLATTGAIPGNIATGQTITGPDLPSSTTITGIAGNVLTLSNSANANNTDTVRILTGVGLSHKLAVGQGVPVGIPLNVMGVNSSSGTEATFTQFADQGTTTLSGCASNMNRNAVIDPNSTTRTGDNASAHIALENNSAQLVQFASADFPSPDYVDQAVELATTLYIESNGVYNTSPFSAAATINGTSYTGVEMNENTVAVSANTELNNSYPTARTLFNIYRSDTVRASTGGLLNWICDPNTNFLKSQDNSSGANFDTELGNTISTVFGFPRLTDQSEAASTATPADGLSAPNDSCQASLKVNTTSGLNTVTLTAGGSFPVDIPNQGGLSDNSATPYPTDIADYASDPADSVVVGSANTPLGAYVVSGSGTTTLTLSAAATNTGTVTMTFGGVPSVTSVANSQS